MTMLSLFDQPETFRTKVERLLRNGDPVNRRVIPWLHARPNETRGFEFVLFTAQAWAEWAKENGKRSFGNRTTADQPHFDVWLSAKYVPQGMAA